jgi:hypothetical protein
MRTPAGRENLLRPLDFMHCPKSPYLIGGNPRRGKNATESSGRSSHTLGQNESATGDAIVSVELRSPAMNLSSSGRPGASRRAVFVRAASFAVSASGRRRSAPKRPTPFGTAITLLPLPAQPKRPAAGPLAVRPLVAENRRSPTSRQFPLEGASRLRPAGGLQSGQEALRAGEPCPGHPRWNLALYASWRRLIDGLSGARNLPDSPCPK